MKIEFHGSGYNFSFIDFACILCRLYKWGIGCGAQDFAGNWRNFTCFEAFSYRFLIYGEYIHQHYTCIFYFRIFACSCDRLLYLQISVPQNRRVGEG